MTALIDINGKKYYSHIFALMKNGTEALAVVFNDAENKFELINVYRSKYLSDRQVTLIDEDTDGLIEKDEIQLTSFKATECLGYDWLLNDAELLKAIERGDTVDERYIELAKEINASADPYGWHDVTDEIAVTELMEIAGGFHDSFLVGMHYVGSSDDLDITTKIHVIFELYGKSKIELEFGGNVQVHYQFEPHFNGIYSSTVLIDKNCVYWIEGDDECRLCDIDEDTSYIKAEKLRWRIAPDDEER